MLHVLSTGGLQLCLLLVMLLGSRPSAGAPILPFT